MLTRKVTVMLPEKVIVTMMMMTISTMPENSFIPKNDQQIPPNQSLNIRSVIGVMETDTYPVPKIVTNAPDMVQSVAGTVEEVVSRTDMGIMHMVSMAIGLISVAIAMGTEDFGVPNAEALEK